METLLNRYRNITVLLLVIFAQLILLAYQVKNDSDVRMIRVWAVTAVTPLARAVEGVRSGTEGFLQNYVLLRDTHAENQRMRSELGRLKLENQFLKTELATADRAKALTAFEAHSPSKMIAARVTGTATGASASAVFVDRGSTSGVEKGMAVLTPDGIVGKVLAAYPTASLVLLAPDPSFAAGVVSQKHHVRGVLQGLGHGSCRVYYVQNEEKVENGEWFYTSGDDRIFPKGVPVGPVTAARSGNPFQEITVEPSGLAGGLEEVLIILQGVHQEIPEVKTAAQPVYLAPPPPATPGDSQAAPAQPPATGGGPNAAPALATDADKIREHYEDVGAAQNHKFGDNPPGSKPADFNLQIKPGEKPANAPKPADGERGGAGGTSAPQRSTPSGQRATPNNPGQKPINSKPAASGNPTPRLPVSPSLPKAASPERATPPQ
jgi:rod shape-determining protein MreC